MPREHPTNTEPVPASSRLRNAKEIRTRLRLLANEQTAQIMQRFFKTGAGEYGEGDVFLDVKVPSLRKLLRNIEAVPLAEMQNLLNSAIHEERLLALLLLVRTFAKAEEKQKKLIYELYLQNARWINNWDLVDASAEHIVGAYLL